MTFVVVHEKRWASTQLPCSLCRFAHFLSHITASSARCFIALECPLRQDNRSQNPSFNIPEWHLDVLIDVISWVEVGACSLQWDDIPYENDGKTAKVHIRGKVRAATQARQKFSCLLHPSTTSTTQHVAIRFTLTWGRFLLTVCFCLSEFLLLYISCSTSRNCFFLVELSCLESWEEIDHKTVYVICKRSWWTAALLSVVLKFIETFVSVPLFASVGFSPLLIDAANMNLKTVKHLSTHPVSYGGPFADAHIAAILEQRWDKYISHQYIFSLFLHGWILAFKINLSFTFFIISVTIAKL